MIKHRATLLSYQKKIVAVLFDMKNWQYVSCQYFPICQSVKNSCQTVKLSIFFVSVCQIVKIKSVDFKPSIIIQDHLWGMYVDNQYSCHGAIDSRYQLSNNYCLSIFMYINLAHKNRLTITHQWLLIKYDYMELLKHTYILKLIGTNDWYQKQSDNTCVFLSNCQKNSGSYP